MNKVRFEKIAKIKKQIETILVEENDQLADMSESDQDSDKEECCENNIEILEDVLSGLEEISNE